MFTLVDALARRLVQRGIRRGLLEGNPVWLAIGVAGVLVRLLRRSEKEQVLRETLRVGESLTVRHVAPPDRRRARRSSGPGQTSVA